MKRLFLILVLSVFALINNITMAAEMVLEDNVALVKSAIAQYKSENYVQCVNILSEYVKTHPRSVAAYYYLGCAYMKVGLPDKAIENFNKVADINTVPQFTSYALQAVDCMSQEIPVPCVYYAFSTKQIVEMQANPAEFLANVRNNLLQEDVAEGYDEEIDKLIHGEYYQGIHQEAKEFLERERMNRTKYEYNKRSMLPLSTHLVKAVKAPYPVHSYAPNAVSKSKNVTPSELELVIMSETAALQK